jgi:hypothetical protein
MYRKRRIALTIAVGTAVGTVALSGTLFGGLGLADALGVVAVATVLLGHYLLRHLARHALAHDRRRVSAEPAASLHSPSPGTSDHGPL